MVMTGRRGGGGIPPIVMMGHEAAGRIAAVGAGVTGLAERDRVTFDSTRIYCEACEYCWRGEVNLSADRRQVLGSFCAGITAGQGASVCVNLSAVPARVVYKLPASVSFAEAAMLEAAGRWRFTL